MITQPKPLPTANAPQEGFVLIVGLVILGLLTMLALSGMRDSTIQEKMAGASRASFIASNAAESALRDAENCITGATADCEFNTANEAHFAKDDAFPEHNTLFNATTWEAFNPPGDPTELAGVPSKGKGDAADGANYIIRQAGTVSGVGDSGAANQAALAGGGMVASAGPTSAASSQKIYEITARGAGEGGAGQSVLRVYYRN